MSASPANDADLETILPSLIRWCLTVRLQSGWIMKHGAVESFSVPSWVITLTSLFNINETLCRPWLFFEQGWEKENFHLSLCCKSVKQKWLKCSDSSERCCRWFSTPSLRLRGRALRSELCVLPPDAPAEAPASALVVTTSRWWSSDYINLSGWNICLPSPPASLWLIRPSSSSSPHLQQLLQHCLRTPRASARVVRPR